MQQSRETGAVTHGAWRSLSVRTAEKRLRPSLSRNLARIPPSPVCQHCLRISYQGHWHLEGVRPKRGAPEIIYGPGCQNRSDQQVSPLARATSLVQKPGQVTWDPTPSSDSLEWPKRAFPRLSVKPCPHHPALAALPPRLPCWPAAGPVEGLPAPGSRRGGGCPVSTPARLLQRGLAEFSVGEAHQAAAITAGPAYGSHFRGTGGRRQARCGGRGLELRRGRRSPAEAEHRAKSWASAQQETSGRSGGAACSAAETAPPRRACAMPSSPSPPPAWLPATRRELGWWAYCVQPSVELSWPASLSPPVWCWEHPGRKEQTLAQNVWTWIWSRAPWVDPNWTLGDSTLGALDTGCPVRMRKESENSTIIEPHRLWTEENVRSCVQPESGNSQRKSRRTTDPTIQRGKDGPFQGLKPDSWRSGHYKGRWDL
jgi:hypothetical protein